MKGENHEGKRRGKMGGGASGLFRKTGAKINT
jgi:hypothetical protein